MGKIKENPRYHMLSVRVSEEEYKTFHNKSAITGMTVSEVLRHLINTCEPEEIPW